MKAYPAYKEIGLDFLDSLPAHWQIKKLKFLSSVNFSNVDKHSFDEEIPVRLCNYVDVYKNDFITPDMEFMKATASQSEIEKFILREGDVLITKDSESWEDIAVPAFVTENMDDVLCGYHLAQIRPSSISGNFLFWVLCSATLNDQYKVEAHGITRYGLGKDSIENSIIPFPSLSEQQAIADFLDRKTAQIDALIAKKQRQIELLQEQRTALINHAVTKGLPKTSEVSETSEVSWKDSGVEWLGEISNHWETKSLKHLVSLIIDNRGRTPPFGDVGIPMLEVKQITEGDRYPSDSFTKFVEEEIASQYIRENVKEGDILLSTVGATSGRAVLVAENPNYFIAQNVIGIRTADDVDNVFLYYLITSYYFFNSLLSINKSNTIDNLKVSVFINNQCVVPPTQEQREIAKFLDSETLNTTKTINKIQLEIELIREYRTALISEAVTGKIDVRTVHTVHE